MEPVEARGEHHGEDAVGVEPLGEPYPEAPALGLAVAPLWVVSQDRGALAGLEHHAAEVDGVAI